MCFYCFNILCFLWHYSPWWILAFSKIVVQFQILEASQQNIFMGWCY
jgi:hypothetical protein